ncbi:MAG: MFS transporter [Clostridiaceae bacterium]
MKLRIKLGDTFSSLKHRNFRYFWTGQCISLMGTWVQRTAQAWLVYSITKSPLLLGLLGVFQFGPVFLLSLFVGVFVDRFSKKKLLILTQIIFMVQSLILTYLIWIHAVKYWHIALLASIFGLAQTLDMPVRQSFFVELVGKEDLMNAISLNSTITNLAKIIGPSVAGILMVKLGVTACFFINGISFIPVIYGLVQIKVKANIQKRNHENVFKQIKDGIDYIIENDYLKFTVMLMIIVCIFSANSEVIIPVLVSEVLKMGAKEYSFLLSAFGFGALCGAIFMASRSRHGLNKNILIADSILISLAQIFIYFLKQYYIIAVFIIFIGLFYMTFLNMSNSTLQMNTTNEYRGRVMSVYTLIVSGSAPIGNSFAGTVMEKASPDIGYLMCGLVTIVLVVSLLLFRKINSSNTE